VQASGNTLAECRQEQVAASDGGAPSSVQPNHENSTTGLRAPRPGTGGEEQDMVFEAPTGG